MNLATTVYKHKPNAYLAEFWIFNLRMFSRVRRHSLKWSIISSVLRDGIAFTQQSIYFLVTITLIYGRLVYQHLMPFHSPVSFACIMLPPICTWKIKWSFDPLFAGLLVCLMKCFHYAGWLPGKMLVISITVTSQLARWRLQSSASRLFTQPFIYAQIKENIKAPRHWPLCGEFTGDRWISRTNGQ